jgi:hypothetical protein
MPLEPTQVKKINSVPTILERFNAEFTKIEKIVQVSHAPFGYASGDGDAWFDMSSSTDVNRNNRSPSIKGTCPSIRAGVAYDIQGRRINLSSIRMQKIFRAESKGVYIEQGQLRLISR